MRFITPRRLRLHDYDMLPFYFIIDISHFF